MARVMVRAALVLALCFALGGPTEARQDLPVLSGPVTDLASVIDPQSATGLDRAIRALLASTGDTVVVVTVPSLGSYGSIEDYAIRLFQQAGIGDREKDNGVLVLLALAERRVRIEVGYGLEEFITDGFSGDTIRTYMLPAFRRDAYGEGLLAGTQAIIARIAERRGATIDVAAPPPPSTGTRRRESSGGGRILLLILIAYIVMTYLNGLGGGGTTGLRRGGRRGTWSGWHGGVGGFGGGFGSGGFSGGGFGGFSGGSSGGGGASGGW
jgi:uncharacterized protein